MTISKPARIATATTRSCASPRPSPAADDSAEQLMINYNSALKVVNLGEPEASLILRKPRSPHGAGGADPVEPDRLDPRRRQPLGKHRIAGLSSDPGLDPRSLAIGLGPGRSRKRTRPIATRPAMSQPWPATAISRRSGTPSSSAPAPVTPTSWSSTWAACARSKGSSTFRARIAPTAASGISRSGPPPTADPGAARSPRGAGKTTQRLNMYPSPARRLATFSFAA